MPSCANAGIAADSRNAMDKTPQIPWNLIFGSPKEWMPAIRGHASTRIAAWKGLTGHGEVIQYVAVRIDETGFQRFFADVEQNRT